MKRHLLLGVGLMVGLGLFALRVAAQERAGEAGKDGQELQGRIVRDEPAALRVQDMTMDELQQRLAEYEAGKRDDRDGYIILNQLWFNYQAQRRTSSPDFQAIVSKRDGLLKKRPEFSGLKDFRLREHIARERKDQDNRAKRLAAAKAFVPQDKNPIAFWGSEHRLMAAYQYRLEFFELPQNIYVSNRIKRSHLNLYRQVGAAPANSDPEVSLAAFQPKKILTFKHRITIFPVLPRLITGNVLVCMDKLAGYAPRTPEEDEIVAAQNQHTFPWINAAGQHEDFCGVVTLSGEVLFNFEFQQHVPDRLIAPLDIAADGKSAAILLGEKVHEGEDAAAVVGNPREVWIWKQSQPLKKIKVPKGSSWADLREKFRKKEF